MRRHGTKGSLSDYVADRLSRELTEHGAVKALAEKVGVKGPTISNARSYGIVGERLGEGLAEHWGMTYDGLKATAKAWAAERGDASQPQVVTDPRYFWLTDAIRAERLLKYDEQAIANVSELQLDADESPDAEWFLDRIRSEHQLLKRGAKHALGSRPLAPEMAELTRPKLLPPAAAPAPVAKKTKARKA